MDEPRYRDDQQSSAFAEQRLTDCRNMVRIGIGFALYAEAHHLKVVRRNPTKFSEVARTVVTRGEDPVGRHARDLAELGDSLRLCTVKRDVYRNAHPDGREPRDQRRCAFMRMHQFDPLGLKRAPQRHRRPGGRQQPSRERSSSVPNVVQVNVEEVAVDLLAHPFPARTRDRNIMAARSKRTAEIDCVPRDAATLEMSAHLEEAHRLRP